MAKNRFVISTLLAILRFSCVTRCYIKVDYSAEINSRGVILVLGDIFDILSAFFIEGDHGYCSQLRRTC